MLSPTAWLAGAARRATRRAADADRKAFQFADLSSYSFKQRLTIRAASLGIYGLTSLIGRTVRYEIEGREHWDAVTQTAGNAVYAFWHDSIVLATWYFRKRDVVVMSSQSFDGEYTARCIQRFGYGVARGSSTRGGLGALVEMVRLVRQGHPAAFTIDGPKGPRHVAKTGAVLLAKKTGKPVVPLSVTPTRCWTLSRTWDRMTIPRPFSRALVGFGRPIDVPFDADEPILEARQAELQSALDALEQRGQEWRADLGGRAV